MADKPRNPLLAALASLTLPGLGQLYNGQPLLAAGWSAAYLTLSLFYTVRLVGGLGSGAPERAMVAAALPLGLMILVWLAGVVQAIFAALNRRDYELQPYNRGLVYLALYVVLYVALPLLGGRAMLRWALAENGIRTPEEQAAWLARVGALTGGAAPAATLERQLAPPSPVTTDFVLEDPAVTSADAPTVIHVALVGGRDGGIYDVFSDTASCTHRAGPEPGWANLYANPSDSLGLTAVEFRVRTEAGETRGFQLGVNVGNLPGGRRYVLAGGPEEAGTATVVRREGGAVIRFDGRTPEGVRLEVTVQCREVMEE